MKNVFLLILALFFGFELYAQTPAEHPKVYTNNGYYYRDRAQTLLYNGDYREYYENGTLKLELQIKDGLPSGAYVVSFENRKPKEVRSYKDGRLHGIWRT